MKLVLDPNLLVFTFPKSIAGKSTQVRRVKAQNLIMIIIAIPIRKLLPTLQKRAICCNLMAMIYTVNVDS